MNNTDLILEYQNYLSGTGLSVSTQATYWNHVRHFYSFAEFKGLQILDMGLGDVLEYKRALKQIYTDNTINNKLSAVRSFYQYLVEFGYSEKNLIYNSLFITINKLRPQYLDPEERSLLMSYLSSKGDHIQLAFKIMIYAGLRLSEVTQIKTQDVEIRDGSVFLHVRDFKTNKNRLCPVFDEATCHAIIQRVKDPLTGEFLLMISARGLQYHAKMFSEKYGVKFSVHTCRHIYATDRVRSGVVRLELLKTLMGHKSINTTLLYIYVSENEIYSLL